MDNFEFGPNKNTAIFEVVSFEKEPASAPEPPMDSTPAYQRRGSIIGVRSHYNFLSAAEERQLQELRLWALQESRK